jgi:hypothetical protein
LRPAGATYNAPSIVQRPAHADRHA